MTRGAYVGGQNIVTAYDDVFPGWDRVQQRAILGGHRHASAHRRRLFPTGFDYRGEPTPYGWPSASSFFGAMDLCGFPKTEFFIRQSHWVKTNRC